MLTQISVSNDVVPRGYATRSSIHHFLQFVPLHHGWQQFRYVIFIDTLINCPFEKHQLPPEMQNCSSIDPFIIQIISVTYCSFSSDSTCSSVSKGPSPVATGCFSSASFSFSLPSSSFSLDNRPSISAKHSRTAWRAFSCSVISCSNSLVFCLAS